MDNALIGLAGSGDSAKITALALAEAGLPVALAKTAPRAAKSAGSHTDWHTDWQSVLALSPVAKTMLEKLGVWARLDQPDAPVLDMRVYGCADDIGAHAGAARLDFAPDMPPDMPIDAPPNTPAQAAPHTPLVSPLAHIVSRAALGRAIAAALDAAITAKRVGVLDAAIVDFDPASPALTLANGDTVPVSLLVDTLRAAPPWRKRLAARPLRHDYQAKALVATVQTAQAHGYVAHQIFLPDGPLALLPLPQTDFYAMVWSLPNAKATALAHAGADILTHELARATQNRLGRLTARGAMATQPLNLQLAEKLVDGAHIMLGEAAHLMHPLAGQGFNLTLRDAAQLADCLFDARRLGLALSDGTALAEYEKTRRADAAVTAGVCHGLACLFAGSLAPWGKWGSHLGSQWGGRLGLALAGRAVAKYPNWRAHLSAQANHGLGAHLPRLLRGGAFGG